MPEPLTSMINVLAATMGTFRVRIDDVAAEMYQLGTHLGWEGNPNSGNQADVVAAAIEDMADKWGVGTTSVKQDLLDCLVWIDANWAVGGANMDDILTAMLGASFEQLTTWMGLTDAYKVAVWNAPFNAEYYAALARGFRKW